MISKNKFKITIFIFFIIYFFLGSIIYKDFGIGIEEHFQRQNGFYWLNIFISNTNFESLKTIVDLKYNEILQTNPDLPNPTIFNFYGILFDLPLALIESLFKMDESKSYFELRHFSIFLVFFVSSIYFYKILIGRFNNNLIIFLGLFLYIFTPRIFGDSFHNNKDILFLSILTISISYLFKLFKKDNLSNLVLFCFFSAFATSSRIMGIYLPMLLIIFYFLEYLNHNLLLKNFILKSLKVIIFFYFFLLMHYPYAWQLNIFELQSWFKNFFYSMDIEVLFNGQYYPIKYLPRSYLPILISITTPIIILFIFAVGVYHSGNRIFKSILSVEERKKNNKENDLWGTIDEKKDLFIFISLFSFVSFAIFLNVAMLSGWRHFYFLHFFIVYFSTLGAKYLYNFLIEKINIKTAQFLVLLIIGYLLFLNLKFHPYQSLYFNNFFGLNYVNKFQVDTPSLSRSDALKFIIKEESFNKGKIYVANASWTPMYNGKDMLSENSKEKLIFVGQEYQKADYIYTNYVYKSDNKYDKSFVIPSNFKKIKDFKIDNIVIYSIYKKII